MCCVGPTFSTLVRLCTGVVRFLLFLVGWPVVVLMFALFETSAPYFIYACVPTSGHTVLARSRFSVGPLSKTLVRYWTATGSVYWVVMCCCWAYMWAVYLEFFTKNVIIFFLLSEHDMSTRSWTHTLVGHRVDMSCLLGKQVKLPGTQDMFALFWISVGTLSMTLTQRWANMNWKCRLFAFIWSLPP